MSTTLIRDADEARSTSTAQKRRVSALFGKLIHPAWGISALTLVALAIHGYHPYADDGAIYLTGIEKVARPGLFPVHATYVLPPLQHSAFSFVVGWLIRWSHVPLEYGLFVAYLSALWLMLYSCYRVSCALFAEARARCVAVILMAAILTMPVAGTAIFFFDPYLTARSFLTPIMLLAVSYALESRMTRSALCLVAATLIHPLMAIYAVGYVVALVLVRYRRAEWLAGFALVPLALGFAGAHMRVSPAAAHAYHVAVQSRTYFFLDQWRWFEVLGLLPPLVAAAFYWWRSGFRLTTSMERIAATSLAFGGVALAFALAFTRSDTAPLLARLQPLRAFDLIYILFFLAIGGLLGRHIPRRRLWILGACLGMVASIMSSVQFRVYPSLPHVEWPWSQPKNPWEQAFLWIRHNTPSDAYFAIDPSYQQAPHEDTVGFRAAAERSVLPDWNKDGGIAAVDPALAEQWWSDMQRTRGFSAWSDADRERVLLPRGVDWIVLAKGTATRFHCPYGNSAVIVCQVSAPETEMASAR